MIHSEYIYTLFAINNLAFIWFAYKRLQTFLKYFQQEEYDNRRFIDWLIRNVALDKRLTPVVLLLGFVGTLKVIPGVYMVALSAAVFALYAWFEKPAHKVGKKPLVKTARARRLLWGALILMTLITGGLHHVFKDSLGGIWHAVYWIGVIQILPLFLMLANIVWWPFEAQGRKRYLAEARQKIADLQPTIIGITGSFGKTSTKHILGHVLGTFVPTLMTPGSVNTPLGNTRVIREKLTAEHKYFIVEMGAYGPGSIKRLCDLTPPSVGIVTAVGDAHYERFKNVETVAGAKHELVDAVFANKGHMILNGSLSIHPNFSQSMKGQWVYGPAKGDIGENFVGIREVETTRDGLKLVLRYKNKDYDVLCPLFGEQHAENIAAVFSTAVSLGFEPDRVVAALKTVPQIKHRLEVKKNPAQATEIDDAYNSNQAGFTGALRVLDVLVKRPGRRILITPGLVELGAKHDEVHKTLGELSARHTDVTVAVNGQRIPSFINAFKAANSKAQLVEVANFDEAKKWVQDNITTEDTYLLENDLPDLYEAPLKI